MFLDKQKLNPAGYEIKHFLHFTNHIKKVLRLVCKNEASL